MATGLGLLFAVAVMAPLAVSRAGRTRRGWVRRFGGLVLVAGIAAVVDPMAVSLLRVDGVVLASHCGMAPWRPSGP